MTISGYTECGSAESYLMGHLRKEDEDTPHGEKNRRTWIGVCEE
jgi:hypothetical protein